jgi:hypothetical protein
VNLIGGTNDDNSIERARLLNEIVDKLSHKSSRRGLLTFEQTFQPIIKQTFRESDGDVHHKVVENKLDRLETMLRDIKRVH